MKTLSKGTKLGATALVLVTCGLLSGVGVRGQRRADAFAAFPPLTVWAWELPERLTFIDPNRVGVAFLAKTLYLGDAPIERPRMQPLHVPAQTKLMAVVRIEARPGSTINGSQEYRQRVTDTIVRTTKLPGVRALQIDFDATESQREFYAELIREVRKQMPPGMPLSITALASWCVGDRWLNGLPIDEAVPMMFRAGLADRSAITHAIEGDGMREPLCTGSVGLSTDEPWPDVRPGSRVYLFHPRPWDAATLDSFERWSNR